VLPSIRFSGSLKLLVFTDSKFHELLDLHTLNELVLKGLQSTLFDHLSSVSVTSFNLHLSSHSKEKLIRNFQNSSPGNIFASHLLQMNSIELRSNIHSWILQNSHVQQLWLKLLNTWLSSSLLHAKTKTKCHDQPSESNSLATQNDECGICLNDINQGESQCLFRCKHPFHKECISEWRKTSLANHNLCPTCRSPTSLVTNIREWVEEIRNNNENVSVGQMVHGACVDAAVFASGVVYHCTLIGTMVVFFPSAICFFAAWELIDNMLSNPYREY
jgi:hypothetical protein